jgi:hypothetical protein
MSLPSAVIDALVASGCTVEQLAAAMKAANAAQDERLAEKRAKDAERQRKCRSKNKKPDVSRGVTVTECDPPNDIYSNPPNPQSSNDDCPPLEIRVVDFWNEAASKSGLTKSRGMDASRKKHLMARKRDHGEEAVFDAIRRISASSFHCGQNDRGWQANLGWMLKSPENFLKCLELPEPPKPIEPVDHAEYLASKIEFYRKIGKDWEADECARELAKLRGPPQNVEA